MKYILFPLAMIMLGDYLSAQNVVPAEQPDTLLHVSNPSKVIITENSVGTTVTVDGIEGDETFEASVTAAYPQEGSVSSRQRTIGYNMTSILGWRRNIDPSRGYWMLDVDGLCVGLSKPTAMKGEDGLQWSKSFEISWLSCIAVGYQYRRHTFTLGIGFDWRNYKISTSDRFLQANAEKGLEWGKYENGERGRFSRLKIFSLQFPLLYSLSIPSTSLYLKCGPIFNFNTYGSLKTVYDDADGNRCEDFTKDISPRRFTVDLFGSLTFNKGIGFYVRYSTAGVMRAPGLNFTPLTVGVMFGLGL